MGTIQPMRARRRAKCPICGKAPAADLQPFCSRRCAQIDLGRWLNGSYAIPGEQVPDPNSPEGGGASKDEDEV